MGSSVADDNCDESTTILHSTCLPVYLYESRLMLFYSVVSVHQLFAGDGERCPSGYNV